MKVLRFIIPATLAVGLCACSGSGGGSGNIFGGGNPFGNQCFTGTSEQLASPTPGQTTSNVNQIIIVASGSSDNIHSSPGSWSVFVTPIYGGNSILGGQLSPVPDTTGPHPYAQDFYYASQLQQTLPSGMTWNVYLTQNSGACNAIQLQEFST
jgi:hypothetical protein